MINRQPSICCIIGWLLFSETVFKLKFLYFSRQFVPVAYAGIKKEVCPEPFTLGMTHAKLLALVGYLSCWYAGIAMQVLQYLREFDAPAMQSCKPLPCGTGSCQNRRPREQTLTRKPCHCGSIKGGWCMELPTSPDQSLQGQIVCACLDMFLPV